MWIFYSIDRTWYLIGLSNMLLFLILVHLCDQGNNGGCEHVCNKKGDEVLCACNKEYKLAENNSSCI